MLELKYRVVYTRIASRGQHIYARFAPRRWGSCAGDSGMPAWRSVCFFLIGAVSLASPPAAFAQQAVSMPGCNSVWSDGTWWANTITNPPSLTPPVDGEFVGISPTTTVTLDQDAHPSTLDVFGTMNQAGHSLTADNVVVAPA